MSEGDDRRKKRSLILAGGGIKVAYQAGVLQVWLDEAGLTFDHADGASGGTFNLAMYCQGMSGVRIADNWRNLSPHLGVDFNLAEYGKFFYAESLFTLDRYREKVFPGWRLVGRLRPPRALLESVLRSRMREACRRFVTEGDQGRGREHGSDG